MFPLTEQDDLDNIWLLTQSITQAMAYVIVKESTLLTVPPYSNIIELLLLACKD